MQVCEYKTKTNNRHAYYAEPNKTDARYWRNWRNKDKSYLPEMCNKGGNIQNNEQGLRRNFNDRTFADCIAFNYALWAATQNFFALQLF